jgi:hypothetical protein
MDPVSLLPCKYLHLGFGIRRRAFIDNIFDNLKYNKIFQTCNEYIKIINKLLAQVVSEC